MAAMASAISTQQSGHGLDDLALFGALIHAQTVN